MQQSGHPPPLSRIRPVIVVVGLLIIAAAAFAPVVNGYWLADDFDWVKDFHQNPWSDVFRLFLGNWSRAESQEYRPLWALSFMTDLRLWGLSPLALHVTNVLFHLACCALVWRLAVTVPGADALAAALALAFFVLLPVHAEPVSWIAARGHLLVTIFILGSLILLRRFEQRGGRIMYAASVLCAMCAFATMELAVSLPPLLLLRDLMDAPRRDRRWIRRSAAIHAPFWALLAAYLAFRFVRFGMLGRPTTPTSVSILMNGTYLSLRSLWLSPFEALDPLNRAARITLKGAALLLLPLLGLSSLSAALRRGRRDLTRGLLFFAVLWPLTTTAILFGAQSPRHLYLASVGVSIAFGLACSALIGSTRPAAVFGSVLVVLLLAIHGAGLASSVALYGRNGRLSRALAQEVDRVLRQTAPDRRAVVAIVPELSWHQVVFWDYFFPTALMPPFRRSAPPPHVLPAFSSCHCRPEDWKNRHAETLALLARGPVSAVYVVLWDERQSAFVTRVLSPPEFWQAGYLSRDGALVRPFWTGAAQPQIP